MSKSKRVLVVDDNVDAATMLAELLRRKGHDVSVANASADALDLCSTFSPEVVLLDIGLPEIDGYEVARRIIRSGATCRLVAVTGYGRVRDRERALEAGFSAHLVKPVGMDALLSAIVDGS